MIASALVAALLQTFGRRMEDRAGRRERAPAAVYLLRWYWWRINAWSEISAMTTALVMSLGLRFTTFHPSGSAVDTAMRALLVTGVTTVVWLVVTFATKPEPQEILLKFYRSVRPQITGWKPIAAMASGGASEPGPGAKSAFLGAGLFHGLHGAVWAGARAAGALLGGNWVVDGVRDLRRRAVFEHPAQQLE